MRLAYAEALQCWCVVLQQLASAKVKVADGSLYRMEQEVGEAYWRLGQALAAEHHHPDCHYKQAAKVCCP